MILIFMRKFHFPFILIYIINYLHHSQKWITPLISYETMYFLFGDGTILILFIWSDNEGAVPNIDPFFYIPESIFDTIPFLASLFDDFSFFSKFWLKLNPPIINLQFTCRFCENCNFFIIPSSIKNAFIWDEPTQEGESIPFHINFFYTYRILLINDIKNLKMIRVW